MNRSSLVAIAAAFAPAFAPALLSAQTVATVETVTIVPVPASSVLPLKHTPEPTTPAITAQDLMTRLYIFADDSMMGREAGTLGNVKGTDYIASQIKQIGLVPAGDNGTYFQTIPLKTRSVSPSSSLGFGGVPLKFGTDWVASTPTAFSNTTLPVIYGGTLGDSAHMLPPGAAAGKLVVFRMPADASPRALRGAARSVEGAAAVAIVGVDQFMPLIARPSTFVDDPSNAPPTAPKPTIVISTTAAPQLFTTPWDQLTPGAAGKTASVNIAMNIVPVPFPARNVVGILPGSDPKLRGEYVAVGAHNDHIGMNNHPVDHDSLRIFNHVVRPGGAEQGGKQATAEEQTQVNAQLAAWRAAHPNSMRPDSIANGADDDGSGSVAVLEIAQKMASLNPKPKRSTVFVWHVGEEKGLLGSAYYTDHPTVPRDSIVAQLNIDMIGRGDAWDVTGVTKEGVPTRGSTDYVQLIGSRRLSTELGNLVESVNTTGKHNLKFDYSLDANGHPLNIYCRSDHYEYARYGIPITFFTTGGHSDYHQVTDEPEYIDYQHMARVANLVEDVAVNVGNLDHRIVVDQTKPDPHGSCRQ
ncbi:MAG: M28 family peptidase [Gemmatimonadaceae bacterium]